MINIISFAKKQLKQLLKVRQTNQSRPHQILKFQKQHEQYMKNMFNNNFKCDQFKTLNYFGNYYKEQRKKRLADEENKVSDETQQIINEKIKIRDEMSDKLEDYYQNPKNVEEMIQKNVSGENALLKLPVIMNSKKIGLYWQIQGEPEMISLMDTFNAMNKTFFLPRMTFYDNGQMEFHQYTDFARLKEHISTGIMEPHYGDPRIEPKDLDVIILPAVAVDRKGNRLGHGWGYYDRYLARCPNVPKICRVYDFQILEKVPILPHDQKVTYIVSDSEVLDFSQS